MTFLIWLLPVFVAVSGAGGVTVWLSGWPAPSLSLRVPGQDNRPPDVPATRPSAFPPVTLAGSARPAGLPGSWPNLRGPDHDNISKERVALARSWPAGGPKVLWSVDLGEGYAGPAVRNGRVYLLDYDEQERADALRCLSLADGKEIWRTSYPVEIRRNHGMSRTTPAVTDDFVVTLGPKVHVMCADARTGKFLWGIDLLNRYGARIPRWYAGQCPLIVDGKAILAPGGKALMIAVDCRTGKVLWETPNPDGWRMTHSSIRPMTVLGRRMYVYCASGGVAGVDAETGELLWRTKAWRIATNVPQPIPVGDGRIFLTGGYGAGSMMLQLRETGGRITAEPLYTLKPDVFGCEQQTPILHDGHLFGILSKGVGEYSTQMVCLGLDGKRVWSSGRQRRFSEGLGPYMMADGLMFILDDEHLTLIEPSVEGYKELARAKVLDGPEAWGPMAIAGGRLLVRDAHRMVCLDVRAR